MPSGAGRSWGRPMFELLPEVLSEVIDEVREFARVVFSKAVMRCWKLDPDGMRKPGKLVGFICLGKEVKK